jgi:hypothetical protein
MVIYNVLFFPTSSLHPTDMFGAAVEVSGAAGSETVFVGAPQARAVYPNTHWGAVYVYRKQGGTWRQDAVLRVVSGPPGLGAGALAFIGHGIRASGPFLVVSAVVRGALDGATNKHAAYAGAVVFEQREGGWVQRTWLLVPEAVQDSQLFRIPENLNRTLPYQFPGRPAVTPEGLAVLQPHFKIGIQSEEVMQSPPRGVFIFNISAAAAAQAG